MTEIIHESSKLPHLETFKLWIRTSKDRANRFNWGRRPLTVDECVHEIEFLWETFRAGGLNPWCEDDGLLDPTTDKIEVEAVPADFSKYPPNMIHTFGFSTFIDKNRFASVKSGCVAPFFFLGHDFDFNTPLLNSIIRLSEIAKNEVATTVDISGHVSIRGGILKWRRSSNTSTNTRSGSHARGLERN